MFDTIFARNVQDAYLQGIRLIRAEGVREETRAGAALVVPWPVMTIYERPWERVLLDPGRDANPFFHLLEAIWMLSGSRDVASIARYNKRMREYSDAGEVFHAAYGYRWLRHFDLEGGSGEQIPNQLRTIIEELRKNPSSRRLVLTMWDPVSDLGREGADFPCNTQCYFRARRVADSGWVLDMTLTCRSNDAIYGAYGANAVHFSVMHELVASAAGMMQGRMYQLSNNLHAYEAVLERVGDPLTGSSTEYWDTISGMSSEVVSLPLFRPDATVDLDTLFSSLEAWWSETASWKPHCIEIPLMDHGDQLMTLEAVAAAHAAWKRGAPLVAMGIAQNIRAPDWRRACTEWLERRQK